MRRIDRQIACLEANCGDDLLRELMMMEELRVCVQWRALTEDTFDRLNDDQMNEHPVLVEDEGIDSSHTW